MSVIKNKIPRIWYHTVFVEVGHSQQTSARYISLKNSLVIIRADRVNYLGLYFPIEFYPFRLISDRIDLDFWKPALKILFRQSFFYFWNLSYCQDLSGEIERWGKYPSLRSFWICVRSCTDRSCRLLLLKIRIVILNWKFFNESYGACNSIIPK